MVVSFGHATVQSNRRQTQAEEGQKVPEGETYSDSSAALAALWLNLKTSKTWTENQQQQQKHKHKQERKKEKQKRDKNREVVSIDNRSVYEDGHVNIP